MHRSRPILAVALLLLAVCVSQAQGPEGAPTGILLEGPLLRTRIATGEGASVVELSLSGSGHNVAAGLGVLLEGFGVPSYYAPSRRLNETVELLNDLPERPVVRHAYTCDGPNIQGLHVTRLIEAPRNEASLHVSWRVENQGDSAQWIAPWVRNEIAPGGSYDEADRIDVPTLDGIRAIDQSGYYPAARNWIAATDPAFKETLYGVFDANQTHAFLVLRDSKNKRCAIQTAFVPCLIEPGAVWETSYRINMVRGLTHVDFATDLLAAQLDHQGGNLEMLIASASTVDALTLRAKAWGQQTPAQSLPGKRFDLAPGYLVRCTYPWQMDVPGVCRFIGELEKDGAPFKLGRDTASPNGAIDTQFRVGGEAGGGMLPWNETLHRLDRSPRRLPRTMAVGGDVAIWFESSLHKVFREDVPEPAGAPDATVRMSLARNERESRQLVFRPPASRMLRDVDVRFRDLVHTGTGARLSASNIAAANVGYCHIRVPTHYEGPTGLWPDPLPAFEAFTAPGGQCSAVWFTVYAPPDTPAGVYLGMIEVVSPSLDPIELWLEVTVHDFALPTTPALKTDFGFWLDQAMRLDKELGGNNTREALQASYLQDALRHRVTLRELAQFPEPATGTPYNVSLAAYRPLLRRILDEGASTLLVPPALLEHEESLKAVNAFVLAEHLQDTAFCHLVDNPPASAWDTTLEKMRQWKALAPDIPIMVTTTGLRPFLPDELDIWAVHVPMLDTVNRRGILNRAAAGNSVWWFVDREPSRPYANFFIDFAAVEHRMLFWQAWALGIEGVHYWCANFAESGKNPWESQLDITPANGDGCLLYPGKNGPVPSIRWEVIRDGIEDYDYLALLRERVRRLKEMGAHDALCAEASQILALDPTFQSLTGFSRDPSVLLAKRREVAEAIVKLDQALK